MFWSKNVFEIPKGAAGKMFIEEITKLINEWAINPEFKTLNLKAAMLLPNLILQKTSSKCKTSVIKDHVKRRMELWKQGKIEELSKEVCAIQARLEKKNHYPRK